MKKSGASKKKPKTAKSNPNQGRSPAREPDGWTPTITEAHYTPQGEHPEDRIHRDREYIRRLQKHLDEVYDALERDLRIKDGSNWLFDFVHNEDRDMEFEDYLSEFETLYKDIVERGK